MMWTHPAMACGPSTPKGQWCSPLDITHHLNDVLPITSASTSVGYRSRFWTMALQSTINVIGTLPLWMAGAPEGGVGWTAQFQCGNLRSAQYIVLGSRCKEADVCSVKVSHIRHEMLPLSHSHEYGCRYEAIINHDYFTFRYSANSHFSTNKIANAWQWTIIYFRRFTCRQQLGNGVGLLFGVSSMSEHLAALSEFRLKITNAARDNCSCKWNDSELLYCSKYLVRFHFQCRIISTLSSVYSHPLAKLGGSAIIFLFLYNSWTNRLFVFWR